jgi:putative spermidine/putrescine transport system substrate-binding protein
VGEGCGPGGALALSRSPVLPLAVSSPRLTRRALLGGALTLAAGVTGCGGGQTPRWAGRYLTVVTTGGALRQTLYAAAFDPFHRATGCVVHDVSLPASEIVRELRRQSLVGRVQWDVAVLDAPHAALAARETPDLFAPASEGDDGTAFAVETLAVACRTGALDGRLPASWADVWSARVPGVRLCPQDPVGLLEAALLADDVVPGELYPLDLDRAFGSLDRLRALAPEWWQLSERAGATLALGGADLAMCYGSQLRAAIDGGADATIAPLPSPTMPLLLTLPQRAPNTDVGRDFIAHLLGEEAQATLRQHGYGAAGSLPPSGLALDAGWWREQGGEAMARFERWFGAGEAGG